MITFFIVLFCCCSFASAAPTTTTSSPQRCEKIALNVLAFYHGNDLTNISVNIGLTQDENKNTFISYDNLASTVIGKYSIDYLCFAFNDSILCPNGTTTGSSNYIIGNTTFYLHAHSPDHPDSDNLQYVYTGFVDENSISLNDGAMFTLENPCYQRSNAKICCASFKPEPPVKTTSNCLAFKSRTTIYDVTDDYFVFATSQVNYTVENGSLSFTASFHANEGLSVQYSFNQNFLNTTTAGPKAKPIQSGILPIGDNFKGFFEMTVHTHNPDFQDDYYVPNARLFYRNSQSLIEEGHAFTEANNCQYLSTIVSADHVASSQYCCIQFE